MTRCQHILFSSSPARDCLARSLARSLVRNMFVHMATWGTVSSVYNTRASFKETIYN